MIIGNMVWEIGNLSPCEQIKWIGEHGFDAVSFHSWDCHGRGIDCENISEQEISDLKKLLEPFKVLDIHAPFGNYDVVLDSINEKIRKASVETIISSLNFASQTNAETVTVHSGPNVDKSPYRENLKKSLLELEEATAVNKTLLAVETEMPEGYKLIREINSPHIGLTLDTGHMAKKDGQGYKNFGSIGNVIKEYSDKVIHMHIHDLKDEQDHIPPGTGTIDFDEIITALKEVNYKYSICLELNPTFAGEKEIIESLNFLKTKI